MAAAAPAGSGGVIFLPWLNGTIVPCEDPHVRGGFINLSLNTGRRHLSRAIMEGLAFNNRWTREAAEKFIGRRIDRFRFSGGGALSDVWAQIHADVLGVPVRQVDDPVNATVRGTALLALITLGYRSIDEISNLVKFKREFEPDESNRNIYDPLYTQYRALFKKNRSIFKKLNKSY
jgi:xylulokinase